jgi:hypothetical protein
MFIRTRTKPTLWIHVAAADCLLQVVICRTAHRALAIHSVRDAPTTLPRAVCWYGAKIAAGLNHSHLISANKRYCCVVAGCTPSCWPWGLSCCSSHLNT